MTLSVPSYAKAQEVLGWLLDRDAGINPAEIGYVEVEKFDAYIPKITCLRKS